MEMIERFKDNGPRILAVAVIVAVIATAFWAMLPEAVMADDSDGGIESDTLWIEGNSNMLTYDCMVGTNIVISTGILHDGELDYDGELGLSYNKILKDEGIYYGYSGAADKIGSFTFQINGHTFTINVHGAADTSYVAFDARGGDCGCDGVNVLNGSSVGLPSAVMEGHDFLGWYADGQYVGGAGDRYTPADDVILTAVFDGIDYGFAVGGAAN